MVYKSQYFLHKYNFLKNSIKNQKHSILFSNFILLSQKNLSSNLIKFSYNDIINSVELGIPNKKKKGIVSMFDYSVSTDKGGRKVNEDSAAAVQRKDGLYLFVAADGLGGHGKGDIASSFVTDSICKSFLETKNIDENFIENAIEKAQRGLVEKKKKMKNNMSMLTTAAVLVADDTHFQFGYIGDSRVYYFRQGKAFIRSKDHSVPQLLVESGEITEEEIRNHPDRNKILKVLGIEGNSFDYTISDVMEYKKGDAFLLCTDGFWENVVENQMEYSLNTFESAGDWQKNMCKTVSEKKNDKNLDNYTSIAIKTV